MPRPGRWLLLPALLLVGGSTMFDALQRQLIYFPQRAPAAVLEQEAVRSGLQPWRDAAGALVGWRAPGSAAEGHRMVVFHGNAGQALDRTYYAEGLRALGTGWETYLFEYPGYGARDGEPSEKTIKAAAGRALRQLLAEDARPVYLTGESLGSGVASHLAAEFPEQVAGLLLVTPFTRLGDVAARHFPVLPVRNLLSEKYDNQEALSHYRGPVAFLLAGQDEVVPTELGQTLHDGYPGPKWLRVQAGAGHNTLDLRPGAAWWREVEVFLTGQR